MQLAFTQRFCRIATLTGVAMLGSAAVAAGVTMSPSRVELTATPGRNYETRLEITASPGATVSTAQSDFTLSNEGRVVFLRVGSVDRSCSTWLSADAPASAIPAGGTLGLTARIQIPAQATAPGTYWCSQVFSPTDPGEQASGVHVQVAVIYYINVGTLSYKPALGNLKFDAASRSFSFVMQNQGNALLRMAGTLTLLDAKGATLASVPVTEFPLLPGGKRNGTVALPASVKASGTVVALLSFTQPGVRPVAAQGTFKL